MDKIVKLLLPLTLLFSVSSFSQAVSNAQIRTTLQALRAQQKAYSDPEIRRSVHETMVLVRQADGDPSQLSSVLKKINQTQRLIDRKNEQLDPGQTNASQKALLRTASRALELLEGQVQQTFSSGSPGGSGGTGGGSGEDEPNGYNPDEYDPRDSREETPSYTDRTSEELSNAYDSGQYGASSGGGGYDISDSEVSGSLESGLGGALSDEGESEGINSSQSEELDSLLLEKSECTTFECRQKVSEEISALKNEHISESYEGGESVDPAFDSRVAACVNQCTKGKKPDPKCSNQCLVKFKDGKNSSYKTPVCIAIPPKRFDVKYKEIFVDPENGSDRNSGTDAKASLKSIEGGLKVLEKLRSKTKNGDFRINLKKGDYRITQPIILGKSHSSPNAQTVISGNGSSVMFSENITNWSEKELSKLKTVLYSRVSRLNSPSFLSIKGGKTQLARFPKNQDLSRVLSLNFELGSIVLPLNASTQWLLKIDPLEVKNIHLVIQMESVRQKLQMQSASKLDAKKIEIKLSKESLDVLKCLSSPKTSGCIVEPDSYKKMTGLKSLAKNPQFYFANHPSFVEDPGDFAFVANDGIYLLPPKNVSKEELNKVGVEVPIINPHQSVFPMLAIVNAANVKIENIGFEFFSGAHQLQGTKIFNQEGQKYLKVDAKKKQIASEDLSSAILIQGSSFVLISKNSFTNIDGAAVRVIASEGVELKRNFLMDIGYGGVNVLDSQSIKIEDNIISNVGLTNFGDAINVFDVHCGIFGNNTVQSIGRSGFRFRGKTTLPRLIYKVKVRQNLIENALVHPFFARGAIHVDSLAADKPALPEVQFEVTKNVISNISSGTKTVKKQDRIDLIAVSLDSNTQGIYFGHNFISNVDSAINHNCATQNIVKDNSVSGFLSYFNGFRSKKVSQKKLNQCSAGSEFGISAAKQKSFKSTTKVIGTQFKKRKVSGAGAKDATIKYWQSRGRQL